MELSTHHRDGWGGVCGGRVRAGLAGVGGYTHIPVLAILLVEGCSAAAQHDEQEIEDGLDDEACHTSITHSVLSL